MRSITIKQQRGFSMLELAIVLSILTILTFQLIPYQANLIETRAENYAIRGLNDIAEAAKAYYADEDEVWYRAWPGDIATLTATGYLQNFSNANGFGAPYALSVDPTSGGLIITTTVDDAVSARTIATNYGPLASVSGSVLTVGVVIPGNETSHDMLVQIEGDTMIGDLVFNGANIEMGDNQVLDASQVASRLVTARTAAQDGAVTADTVETDFISADDYEYIPPPAP